jgi:molybdenum cofactor cytidylyltransferase
MRGEPDLNVGGLVLASGLSHRFGRENKLLAEIQGQPVIRRTVQAYDEAGVSPVVVVVGYQSERVGQALDGLNVHIVSNPDYFEGQSRALVHGVRKLPATLDAVVIGVGDQPLLRPAIIRSLVQAFVAGRAPIIAPRYGGMRGNPVLFARSLFSELLTVDGDQGGRPVIERHRAEVVWVDVDDPGSGLDVDSMRDLEDVREIALGREASKSPPGEGSDSVG